MRCEILEKLFDNVMTGCFVVSEVHIPWDRCLTVCKWWTVRSAHRSVLSRCCPRTRWQTRGGNAAGTSGLTVCAQEQLVSEWQSSEWTVHIQWSQSTHSPHSVHTQWSLSTYSEVCPVPSIPCTSLHRQRRVAHSHPVLHLTSTINNNEK